MDCKTCKENKVKGPKQYELDIISATHQRAMTILWRIILGQTIIIALLIGGIFFTVNNYDIEMVGTTQTVSVDGKDGVANYIGNDGSIANYGENSGNDNSNQDEAQTEERPVERNNQN